MCTAMKSVVHARIINPLTWNVSDHTEKKDILVLKIYLVLTWKS